MRTPAEIAERLKASGGVLQNEQGECVFHWHGSDGACFTPSNETRTLCELGWTLRDSPPSAAELSNA